MDEIELVRHLKENENLSFREIGERLAEFYPERDIHQLTILARNTYHRHCKTKEPITQDNNLVSNNSVEYKSDGTTTFNGIVALMDGEPITPETIMKAHNLNPKEWEVVSYRTNFWQSQAKNSKKILLYQSKITVRPKQQTDITFEDIDNYFKNKDYGKSKPPIICLNHDVLSKNTLEICLADAHVGLLAWRNDSGNDYDLKIARDRFYECIEDIKDRCRDRKPKKIVFASLGDFLHIDNVDNATTKGTRQDVDGRVAKIVEYAEDMLINGLTMLGDIAPIEYVYCRGNHDTLSGYMLARSAMNAFRNDKNITFDLLPNPIKKKMYGSNLVMYHHGDLSKQNIDDLIPKFAREEFGKSRHSELHMAHLHDEISRTKGGSVIRNISTITASSYWEHKEGYSSPIKAVSSFLWNDERGLREMWYSNV